MKRDLLIDPPYLNASGTLGFTPDPHDPLLEDLGAFVTNPVSRAPRTPAHGPRCLAYPGGFLLHTGHPNPGLRKVLQRSVPAWRRHSKPVLVHLLVEHAAQAVGMVRRLEAIPGVAGVELGLPPDIRPAEAVGIVQRLTGELPVIIQLPLEGAGELARAVVDALARPRPDSPDWGDPIFGDLEDEDGDMFVDGDDLEDSDDEPAAGFSPAAGNYSVAAGNYSVAAGNYSVAAFSLAPPRGALAVSGGLRHGRLYGPAVFPLALAALHALRPFGLPVIAGGGVYHRWQAEAMLSAGALAVQLDAVLWRGGLPLE